MGKYDPTEAIDLLTKATAQLGNFYKDGVEAANELLEEMAALPRLEGVQLELEGGQVELSIGRRMVAVAFSKAEQVFYVRADDTEETAVTGLVFDPMDKLWRSTAQDTFFTPEPGKRHLARSALAVLMDAALKKLRGLPEK